MFLLCPINLNADDITFSRVKTELSYRAPSLAKNSADRNLFYISHVAVNEQILGFDAAYNFGKQIDYLTTLEADWDGEDGYPLFPQIADAAKRFLSQLDSNYVERISDLYLNPNGTLTIDWSNHQNEKLSIEFGIRTYSFFLRLNEEQPTLVDGENNIPDKQVFQAQLDKLYRSHDSKFVFA